MNRILILIYLKLLIKNKNKQKKGSSQKLFCGLPFSKLKLNISQLLIISALQHIQLH
jgi:hypothetical protein